MNTTVCKSHQTPFDAAPTAPSVKVFAGIVATLVSSALKWSARIRQRKQLARLDRHLLEDIGVGPGEVWAEVNKPFWKA